MANIFYSWQSDLPNKTNRGFIEDCLRRAIKQVKASSDVMLDPCLDRDTKNMTGSPDIVATIFDKIDNASVFVCDVSIIQNDRRPVPNPNVLLELGYAVKALGWERVICLINDHYGSHEDLPFDLRQRRVRTYSLSPEAIDKSDHKAELVKLLQKELTSILSMSLQPVENLKLQFGDPRTRTVVGNKLRLEPTHIPMRDKDEIEDYEPRSTEGAFGVHFPSTIQLGHDNREYNREMAEYLYLSLLLKPVGLVVYNGNNHPLTDLRLEVEFEKSIGLQVHEEMPIRPSPRTIDNIVRSINPIWSQFEKPGDVRIKDLGDYYQVSIYFGKIHAEANAWSNAFFIGANESADYIFPCRIYADQFTSPIETTLCIRFDVETKSIEDLDDETYQKLMQDD